ncbi:hypothetical protein B0H17DRAFT_1142816 [Mycena rosella]|uniref:Uncharacterized protein n=1 Tax=Mycena rosella TaxID=1033263 RepID=A0AAD7CXW4_MYCRO|nr:hypothetical protein B0H17DRAFT_1142816 [Mycena rosella]
MYDHSKIAGFRQVSDAKTQEDRGKMKRPKEVWQKMQELLHKRIALKDALERDKTPKSIRANHAKDIPAGHSQILLQDASRRTFRATCCGVEAAYIPRTRIRVSRCMCGSEVHDLKPPQRVPGAPCNPRRVLRLLATKAVRHMGPEAEARYFLGMWILDNARKNSGALGENFDWMGIVGIARGSKRPVHVVRVLEKSEKMKPRRYTSLLSRRTALLTSNLVTDSVRKSLGGAGRALSPASPCMSDNTRNPHPLPGNIRNKPTPTGTWRPDVLQHKAAVHEERAEGWELQALSTLLMPKELPVIPESSHTHIYKYAWARGSRRARWIATFRSQCAHCLACLRGNPNAEQE